LTLFALIGSFLYIVLTLLAINTYPGPFSPFNDYLSKLGNYGLNPAGAFFYNTAVQAAGLSVIPFTIGIYKFYLKQMSSKILILVLIFGILNGISILMSGVFSEDIYELHFFWSLMIFVTLIPFLLLTNVGLWNHQEFSKPIGIYGLSLGIFDAIFVVYVLLIGTDTGSILEWITIFAFMPWTVFVMIQALRKDRVRSS
jgi:hypothetical protein